MTTEKHFRPFLLLVFSALALTGCKQDAYVKATNTDAGDGFGYAAAISGETVVIGAFGEDSGSDLIDEGMADNSAPQAGAAYVVALEDGGWVHQAYLKAPNSDGGTPDGDLFGFSVAADGDTVVVGAPGEGSGFPDNPADNSLPWAGAAYVFTRGGDGRWTHQAYVKAPDPAANEQYGISVAVRGNLLAVGAPAAFSVGGVRTGKVYLYERDGADWSYRGYLSPPGGAPGTFGGSVAVAADGRVAVGEASANDGAGEVHVFRPVSLWGTKIWLSEATLTAAHPDADDNFGSSLDIQGDRLIVGAPDEDSNATGIDGDATNNALRDSGAAYVFIRDAEGWRQEAYLKASDPALQDRFGSDVAIHGFVAAVGAKFESSGAPLSGAAYFYAWLSDSGWTFQHHVKASNSENGDGFGFAVDVGESRAVVGAHREDSASTGIDGNQSDNSAPAAGAVYVFRPDSDR